MSHMDDGISIDRMAIDALVPSGTVASGRYPEGMMAADTPPLASR